MEEPVNVSDEGEKELVTPVSVSEALPKPPEKENLVVPKAIENILPEKAKIENMVVKNISPTERLFKITLDTGTVHYVQVKKESEKYVVEGR